MIQIHLMKKTRKKKIKQNPETVATGMTGGIGYTKELEEYVINKINESEIVKEQKENPEKNIFSGLDFPKEGEQTAQGYSSLSQEQQMAMRNLTNEQIAQLMQAYAENQNASYEKNLQKLGAVDLKQVEEIQLKH